MPDLHPGDSGARKLEHYWTRGPGLARWATNTHPWTSLVALLTPHVGPAMAPRLASTYFHTVFGYWPGHRQGHNPTGPG
ncbi:hypothetical protein [Corynebacterium heidelbergense]|uniref:hypothetical protein n=1 Tax=Corynebacterium heidelbergense TaxID=2055947 RepID=UPI0011BF35B5|nr:hypothetical protein [Corynebacterium heidelbergense]WCZ36987.1 hypothetical protein CHEID_07270 [Corynebacterium heidelbergense]